MTSQNPSHAESTSSKDQQPPALAPKLHVHRSESNDNVTIRFSVLGKEEEEEELYTTSLSSTSTIQDDLSIVTGVEASEEMFEAQQLNPSINVTPTAQSTSLSTSHTTSMPSLADKKGTNSSSSPTKSLSFPSDKSFITSLKYFTSDASKDGVSSMTANTTTLIKSLVKSRSSDTSQDSSTYRLSDSRLNLHLFKHFTQSRMQNTTTSAAGDSKTAPTSPLNSPDNRSFFKVSEVEARFEDTKRRLSEAIYEPLQLLTKRMDEKSGSSLSRPKTLSTSVSELYNLTSANGQLESNNNDCIKEEDASELDEETTNNDPTDFHMAPFDIKSTNKSFSIPISLDKCSMSALAKQDDEDFCDLYLQDIESRTDTDVDFGSGTSRQSQVPLTGSTEPCSHTEAKDAEPLPSVPYYALSILTILVYGCFILPLPEYITGILLGVAIGFFVAIGIVWLAGPEPDRSFRYSKHHDKLCNVTRLDIKGPQIFKGWMNEIANYDPETYHATLTHSVFVRLEGSIIRLSKPNHNIARRAIHGEQKPDVTYISQKIYDLKNSKVHLVPPSLARKRIWNKKYPICIELGKQDDFISKVEGDTNENRAEGTRGTQEPSRSTSSSRDMTLYLFGRTGRDKEEWFQRFISASMIKVDIKKPASPASSKGALSSDSRSSSRNSLDDTLASQTRTKDSPTADIAKTQLLSYSVYMAALLPKQDSLRSPEKSPEIHCPQSSPAAEKKPQSLSSAQEQLIEEGEDHVAWVNAVVGRLFWDFLREPYWAQFVSKKIQMKLSKIRLPYFMNELTLTELDMGVATPKILQASKPSIDYKGLWFDLDVSYTGSFLMTLETKMNLIRLGKEGESLRLGEDGPRTYCLADSDEESSSAGSSDEEDASEQSNEIPGAEGYTFVGGHKSSKIMRFVDKIAKSKYFQKATETEFIKKKMEEVSNTPLLLTVELQKLQGTLAVNIPPPPTDRIWYGFRKPPHLELKARPKLGEREVTLAHVTDWIEKKLEQELQKIFVMPNMDDLWLTIMHSAMDQRTADSNLACSAVYKVESLLEKESTS
ncbi:testis-expressed protein 2-like isoform X2 [Stigmatopora nigra]